MLKELPRILEWKNIVERIMAGLMNYMVTFIEYMAYIFQRLEDKPRKFNKGEMADFSVYRKVLLMVAEFAYQGLSTIADSTRNIAIRSILEMFSHSR